MWFTENYGNIAKMSLNMNNKLHEEQSKYQKIEIYNSDFFGNVFVLDGVIMLSEKDEFIYHEMITHMPLTTNPSIERVLIIGGGDGGTIRELLKYNNIKEIVLCEIDEKVIEVCKKYLPSLSSKLDDPRVRIYNDDGIKYLETFDSYFDLIISDATDPIGPGVTLYKASYFELAKKALKPDGIFIAQSENPWYDKETLHNMTENLAQNFKNVETFMAPIILYQTGFWTFTFASDYFTLYKFNKKLSDKISEDCKYYNTDIHKASLTLPNFVRDIVVNK